MALREISRNLIREEEFFVRTIKYVATCERMIFAHALNGFSFECWQSYVCAVVGVHFRNIFLRC